jgi:hypothetical protein
VKCPHEEGRNGSGGAACNGQRRSANGSRLSRSAACRLTVTGGDTEEEAVKLLQHLAGNVGVLGAGSSVHLCDRRASGTSVIQRKGM